MNYANYNCCIATQKIDKKKKLCSNDSVFLPAIEKQKNPMYFKNILRQRFFRKKWESWIIKESPKRSSKALEAEEI